MSTPNLDVFQVIADPSRRKILGMLTSETLNINSLAENFEMSRPAVSKHVKILEHADFITIKEVGRERHCILKQEGFNKIKNWVNEFDLFWDGKMNNLVNVLKNKN